MLRKRVILSASQKREICEEKEKNPTLPNLAISESQGSVKKFRGLKWPQLESALSLWVDNALNTKQDIDGEATSALSAESIKNDRLALQQLLTPYDPEDIWNGDEAGLFWKMEPSRVLACGPLSGHKKEKSQVTIFCVANATGTEKWPLHLFISIKLHMLV
ncbi:tigger transposable element-derived protein 6-like [Rhizophagus clarus]|uniref:Tigger transposable element-derived protein 6-like n=1 Tax=Rhizophagus clarus TaxID=94130 RepID=A0A8H3QPR8_9GLOM|nr:tigger transposable element-derived protein 6-like [Rhizophagus clarus]